MPAAAYLLLAGHAFLAPVHPGDAPIHPGQPTSAQITETNRQYAAALAEHALYRTVNEELKKQIIAAIPPLYLAILSDDDMGFADVACAAMLHHLRDLYATITQADLETNRLNLSADWTPDQPIEDLWLRIRETRRFATAGGEAISDATALRLTLNVLEKTGVFLTATERWRETDEPDWTLATFQLHFTKADKERRRKLTAQTAGYHGAHAATTPTPAATPTTTTAQPFSVNTGPCTMWYCWSHGLGRNRAHTSATCEHKLPGHQDQATVINRMGGSNIIMGGRTNRPSTNTTPASSSSS
jgi:hypothetical protein